MFMAIKASKKGINWLEWEKKYRKPTKTQKTVIARELEDEMVKVNGIGERERKAAFYRESIFTCMSQIREIADELELIVDEKDWPFPAYGAVLYSVR